MSAAKPLPSYDPSREPEQPSAIKAWALHPPRWFLWAIRTFWPIPRLFGWAVMSRYEDVAEVLSRHDVFQVPFGDEMARLNDGKSPGTPFILGMDREDEYREQLADVMQAFKRDDVETLVVAMSRRSADDKLATRASNGQIDAIRDLITAVPLDICTQYYGVPIEEPQKFAYATIDLSGYLFGPPPIRKDPLDATVESAGEYVRAVVDRAIDNEERNPHHLGDTVLARLVAAHGNRREYVRSFLIGMITGFVPTNTMAAGHILEVLLSRKKLMNAARDAALVSDDDLLKRCIFEAMRFMPLNPGPFRICKDDYTVASGTRREATIKAGTKVLASTMSAMFDSRKLRKPFVFDPKRPASDYMLFGYGIHWCVGVFIAQAQITQTLKALLLQPGLERAGKLVRRGGFPDHLIVKFGP